MKLAAIFIEWAWQAHKDRCRYRACDWQSMAEWSEGRRDALLSAARLCRDEAKTAVAGRVKR